MKKGLFNLLLVISFCSSVLSESTINITWHVYNSSNVLTFKFQFGKNTCFIISNLSTYYPLSNYAPKGNLFNKMIIRLRLGLSRCGYFTMKFYYTL